MAGWDMFWPRGRKRLTWVVVGQVHNRVSWHSGVLTLGSGRGRTARRGGGSEGDDVVAGLGGGSWASLAVAKAMTWRQVWVVVHGHRCPG